MSFQTELRDDLAEMVADLPVTFTFDGTNYTGTQSERTTTQTLEPGGYLDDFDLTLVVPLQVKVSGAWQTTFTTEPDHGDQITIGSRTYKVIRTSHGQGGQSLTMNLATVNK